MSILPYMHLNRIEFMITYFCTGRCIHCSVGDNLGKSQGESHVRADKAAQAIRWLCEHFPISSVMTFGGEPLLYPDTVCMIHQTARDQGVRTRQVITNGYFSKDPQRISDVASMLKRAGVNDLLLSVDAFHQQFIPLEIVRLFAAQAVYQGIPTRLSPAWLVNAAHENDYNAKTKRLLAQFQDLNLPIGDGNDIFLQGNALKYLADYYPPPHLDPCQKCGDMPYTSPPTDVRSISIDPNGDVVVCSFVIGNMYREPIDDIIARYDPENYPGMRAVMHGGVEGLKALARQNGLDANLGSCYSVCDLCRKVNEIY